MQIEIKYSEIENINKIMEGGNFSYMEHYYFSGTSPELKSKRKLWINFQNIHARDFFINASKVIKNEK